MPGDNEMPRCESFTCEGNDPLLYERFPVGARYCPFCGNELVTPSEVDEDESGGQ